MESTNILQQIGESLGSTATAKSVFGEAIEMPGKTVIPVAKVAYGFGGGFGSGRGKKASSGIAHADDRGQGEGGGGGGGVRAYPAGALEVTEGSTRFIVFPEMRLLGAAFAAGLLLGGLLFSRRLKDR